MLEVKADECAHCRRILLDAPEILFLIRAGCAAVAGPDRVDEDQIGEFEPGILIGDQSRRRGKNFTGVGQSEHHWSEAAKMQVRGSCPRAAVEHESDWTRSLGTCQRVGDIEDFRGDRSLAIAKRQGPGLRPVFEWLAAERDRVRAYCIFRQESEYS